jgi:micrococcal nuclease
VIKKTSILLVFLCACTLPTYDYSRIKVIKVIDGDTVKLANGQSLRYIGVDTPEIKIKRNSRFIYQPQPFALEAKKLNAQLVQNKYISVEFDVEKTDRYGRLLGYCFVNNVFVNAKLVEEGFAVTYTMPPNVQYADTFLSLQTKARLSRKGMWGVYETITPSQASSYVNQIRTVRGKITRSRKSKNCVYLGFENYDRSCFQLVIFKNAYQPFYDKGIKPASYYLDKVVEVSGRIRKYNQYSEIVIYHPSEISILNK